MTTAHFISRPGGGRLPRRTVRLCLTPPPGGLSTLACWLLRSPTRLFPSVLHDTRAVIPATGCGSPAPA